MDSEQVLYYASKAQEEKIYPNVRAIAVRNHEKDNMVVLRYYLDALPTQLDFTRIQAVARKLELLALPKKIIVHSECVFSSAPLYRIAALCPCTFTRHEENATAPDYLREES